MVELRHSISIGSRASSSPMKRDGDLSHLTPDDDDDRHSSKDCDRPFWYHFHSIYPFFNEDSRFSLHNSRICLFFVLLLLLAGLISVLSIVNRLNAPYLCRKDGIVLHCSHVKESPSLWENPFSATTSWKPCAEQRDVGISSKIEQIRAAKPATVFGYELFEGDLNHLRTIKATPTQTGPWIDHSSLKLKHIGRGPFGDVFLATPQIVLAICRLCCCCVLLNIVLAM